MKASVECPERLPNWPQILNRAVEASRYLPFDWQTQNCCLWPANVIELMTGTDVAAKFRRKPLSATQIRRLLKRHGGVAALATKVLGRHGIKPVPVSLAKRGDVVLALTPHGHAGGICLGAECAFPGPKGLVFLRLTQCSHAFSV